MTVDYIDLAKHCIGLDHKSHIPDMERSSIVLTVIFMRQVQILRTGRRWNLLVTRGVMRKINTAVTHSV